MAHVLDFDEGQNTRQNDDVSEDIDATTANWLKSNKLGHVMGAFAQEGLTIEELMDMDAESLDTILDDLVNDNNVANFKKRDKIRIKSKLKSKQKRNNQPQPAQRSQAKPQRVIITEAETTALDSLDRKYQELTSQKTSIEDRLRGFEKEYTKQNKILNESFDQIVAKIEERRTVLLRQMKQKSDEYKSKLSTRMKSVANQRSLLSSTKNQCEQKIHNSSVTTLQGAQQRANKTVRLIDETLLSVQQNHSDVRANHKINVKFDIDKSAINDGIQQWGVVTMIGDKPPPPKINFVQVLYEEITIELLCDSSSNQATSIVKYEINISPRLGAQNLMDYNSDSYSDSSDLDSVEVKQNNEYSTQEVINTNEQNVVFDSLKGLNDGTEYKIRGRVVLKDGQTGEWSQWLVVSTPMIQKRPSPPSRYDHPPSRRKQHRSPKQPLKPLGRALARQEHYIIPAHIQNKGYFGMHEWCKLCEGFDVPWTLLQQQRLFYFVKWRYSGKAGIQLEPMYPGRIDRKVGPRDVKKGKGGWKPPSWTKDVLEDDGGFLDYRPAHRGKTGRAEYGKAGYLPHAKWRKKKFKPEEWAEVQQEINDEAARIEAERERIQWEQDELARKQADMEDKEREEAERRRIALQEEAERLRKLEEERKRKQDEIAREKQRLRDAEEEMERRAAEEEEERLRRLQEEERKRRKMMQEQEELEREKQRLADLQREAEEKRQRELEEQMRQIQAEKDRLAEEEERRRREAEEEEERRRRKWEKEEAERLRKQREEEDELRRQMEEEQKRLEDERIWLEKERERKRQEELAKLKDEEERAALLAKQKQEVEEQKARLAKLKQEQEDEARRKMEEEDARMAKLDSKRQDLEDARRELEEAQERAAEEEERAAL
eukprot:1079630_1